MTSGRVLALGLCLALFTSVVSQECPPCDVESCKSFVHSDCPWGFLKDRCACCHICAKGPGDKCDRTFDKNGDCGPGLTCVPPPSAVPNAVEGVCTMQFLVTHFFPVKPVGSLEQQ
nr:insulin-like growth factor-binding protein 7 [Procambarus clarkii]